MECSEISLVLDKYELKDKFKDLSYELNRLKILIEIPNLYINDYFFEIRNEIDSAVVEKLIKENNQVNESLIKNWIQMIDMVHLIESECLENIKKNKLNSEFLITGKKLIESLELEFLKLEKYLELEFSETFECELERIENEIYDQVFKIEKIVFMNRTLIYFDKKNSKLENYFDKMNTKTTVGKLVIIKNEFFGKRGILSIKNQKYLNANFIKRLTNETIKSDRVREILKEKNSTNQIDEIECDNQIFEINYHYVRIVDEKAFYDLTRITQIDLSDNELKDITPSLFHSLINLTLIDLSHNELEQISSTLFQGLINLTEIYLHGNKLKEIHPELFKGLSQLAVISLHDNQIGRLDPKLFNDLSNLTSINLSFNLLKEIDSTLFKGLSNLSYIDLSMNQLTSLDSELVNGLTNLHRIFTFDNQLTLTDIAPNLMEYVQDFI